MLIILFLLLLGSFAAPQYKKGWDRWDPRDRRN